MIPAKSAEGPMAFEAFYNRKHHLSIFFLKTIQEFCRGRMAAISVLVIFVDGKKCCPYGSHVRA